MFIELLAYKHEYKNYEKLCAKMRKVPLDEPLFYKACNKAVELLKEKIIADKGVFCINVNMASIVYSIQYKEEGQTVSSIIDYWYANAYHFSARKKQDGRIQKISEGTEESIECLFKQEGNSGQIG